MLLDLHTSLSLRNVSPRRVRGVTLLVLAQVFREGAAMREEQKMTI